MWPMFFLSNSLKHVETCQKRKLSNVYSIDFSIAIFELILFFFTLKSSKQRGCSIFCGVLIFYVFLRISTQY